ncbi:MAG: UDP-2,4-diacetamido-2,4,6-trideoxy-beta-L-altropyranose hydrolase [Pseudomonadota bacterium]
MKVAFRVDVSSAIGTGHLRRCLALARALMAQGDEVGFVMRDLGIDGRAMVHEAGAATIAVLPAPGMDPPAPDPVVPHWEWAQVSHEVDSEQSCAALASWQPDIVVVDNYAFDAKWHRAVASELGATIAVIDDLADRALDCALVIDHTYDPDHVRKYRGVVDPATTRVLGGPSYALLGPAFGDAPRYDFREDVRSIGVFMGGVDADGHSEAVLDAIDRAGFTGPVEVVSTSANPNLAALRTRIEARPETTLSLDLPDLATFFAAHDVQIGAGGGASWERCCIGVPTLIVVVADNQNAVAPQLAADGVVALADAPSVDAMAPALAELIENAEKRRELAEKSRALVDGRGAARVAQEMRRV